MGAELADLRLGDIEEQVREALGSLPSLAYQYGRSGPARSEAGASAEEADETEQAFDSGRGPDLRSTELYPMRLDPLTIADDPDYLPRLFDQSNIPRDIVEQIRAGGERTFASDVLLLGCPASPSSR